jgi:hypothetical protein
MSVDGWQGFARDPQHSALSTVASQTMGSILWQTPVDLDPQYSGGELLIHYGSPLVTAANTVLVPVKTGATSGFEVQSRSGSSGALNWTLTTDYVHQPNGYSWLPSFSPTLTPGNGLYVLAEGGTVLYTSTPDAAGPNPPTTTRMAFFGISNYNGNPSAYNTHIFIDTPITSDANGDIFFGFIATSGAPQGLTSGVARIDATGTGTWAPVFSGMSQVATNSAPALSNDGSTLYVLENTGNFGSGQIVAMNSTTLAVTANHTLVDPHTGNNAEIPNDGTASPMIGPDGDVYVGVFENPCCTNNDRGWLLHFSGDLSTLKTPGAFGWDDTPSVVPASMVSSYHGSSSYLLMTKYNNYAGVGTGDGKNKLAILDPNATEIDPITGATVMNEVETILGPTPDPGHGTGAVKEWCINSAAVDPATDSVLAGSEDGKLYRWNLSSNSLTQTVTLTSGLGEAYTPTLIGPDGMVYAINNAILFAVGDSTAASFTVTGYPSPDTAGTANNFTVTVYNAEGDVDSAYAGTVHFSSSDAQAGLPANYTFVPATDAGSHTFSATLKTAGTQSLTATDTVTSITGTQSGIVVQPAAAQSLVISGLASSVTTGASDPFTVTAYDAYNNVATGYTGTVHFTSTDPGATLPADYPFTAGNAGTHNFNATLTSLGSQTITATDTVTPSIQGSASTTVIPLNIFPSGSTPGNANYNGGGSVELGVKFKSSTAGFISGIRFYKGTSNTGTHTGYLWTNTGTLLASATFSGEMASGWQQVNFATPVAIAANTIYIAAYYTPTGFFAYNNNYFTSPVTNGPLTAPASGTVGGNGVYVYTTNPGHTFPNGTYQSSNYWVDIAFTTSSPSTPTQLAIHTQPSPTATAGNPFATQPVIYEENQYGSLVTTDNSTIVTASLATGSGPLQGTLTARVSGGIATFTNLADAAIETITLAFTSPNLSSATSNSIVVSGNTTIFGSSFTGNPSYNGLGSVELGVKFESSSAGYVTGVRFYKGTANTGTHIGYLWSSTGTRLASATFTGETASGWQQVSFSPEVAISANTIYIVSYYSPTGYFAYSNNYFASGVTKAPLTAPASGAVGGNGVYVYTTTPNTAFPNHTYQASNYWVDLVYSPTAAPASRAAITVAPDHKGTSSAGAGAATGSNGSGGIAALDTILAGWASSNFNSTLIDKPPSTGDVSDVSAGAKENEAATLLTGVAPLQSKWVITYGADSTMKKRTLGGGV